MAAECNLNRDDVYLVLEHLVASKAYYMSLLEANNRFGFSSEHTERDLDELAELRQKLKCSIKKSYQDEKEEFERWRNEL